MPAVAGEPTLPITKPGRGDVDRRPGHPDAAVVDEHVEPAERLERMDKTGLGRWIALSSDEADLDLRQFTRFGYADGGADRGWAPDGCYSSGRPALRSPSV